MEYFGRLPCCMIDITVNSAVFLLNIHNIGLQTGRGGLLYHMALLHLLHLATSCFIMHLIFIKALEVKTAESYHLSFCISWKAKFLKNRTVMKASF